MNSTIRKRKVHFENGSKSEENNTKSGKRQKKYRNHLFIVLLLAIVVLALCASLFVDWNALKGFLLGTTVSLTNNKSTKQEDSSQNRPKAKKPYSKAYITSKADNRIRSNLDKIDKLVDTQKYEEASLAADSLLSKYGDSPRALYSKAMSLIHLADLKRSNSLLEQSFHFLRKILDMAETSVPKDLVLVTGDILMNKLTFRGWNKQAVVVQKQLIQRFPGNVTLLNQLGTSYMLINLVSHARNIFEKVLQVSPSDGYAQVHYGFILKTEDQNYTAAIPLLTAGLNSGEPGTQHGRFFFHLGDALYRMGRKQESDVVYARGAKTGMYPSKDQRSMYNCDNVKAQPWWTVTETPYAKQMKVLSDNWEVIREEGLAQMNSKGMFVDEEENLLDHGEWKQLTLYAQGQKVDAACRRVPKTCQLLQQVPDATSCKRGQIKFSVMQPGVHVWPHTGPTNCRIRAHLGLVVPPGPKIRVVDDIRTWNEGAFIVFDDSFEHEVWHEGHSLRLVLIVDFWHPDINAHRRRQLSPI